jgi:uncharacterized membrane protein
LWQRREPTGCNPVPLSWENKRPGLMFNTAD